MRINRCDDCRVNDAIITDLFIKTGESREPTGELTNDGELVDLCGACSAKWLSIYIYRGNKDGSSYRVLEGLLQKVKK